MIVFSAVNVTHWCIEIAAKPINKPTGYCKKIKVHIGSAQFAPKTFYHFLTLIMMNSYIL